MITRLVFNYPFYEFRKCKYFMRSKGKQTPLMWLFTKSGFYMVIEHRGLDSECIFVSLREKYLQQWALFLFLYITRSEHSSYLYHWEKRIISSKIQWVPLALKSLVVVSCVHWSKICMKLNVIKEWLFFFCLFSKQSVSPPLCCFANIYST